VRDHTIDHGADAAGLPAGDEPDPVEPATESPGVPSAEQVGSRVTEPTGSTPSPSTPSPPRTAQPSRWHDAIRDHLAFSLVLLVAAIGIMLIVEYHWREGAALISGALFLSALFRALLSDRRAGLLLVRGRSIDVLSYTALGVGVLFVALTIVGGPLL
jgi:hypothetical protein